jgi:hypothetical protein
VCSRKTGVCQVQGVFILTLFYTDVNIVGQGFLDCIWPTGQQET